MRENLLAILFILSTVAANEQRYPPDFYVKAIHQVNCDYELAKIDYKCDLAFETIDYRAEVFFQTAEKFCEKAFISLDKLCLNKHTKLCAEEYIVREKNCKKRIDDVNLFLKMQYEIQDEICDNDYDAYDKKCGKPHPLMALPTGPLVPGKKPVVVPKPILPVKKPVSFVPAKPKTPTIPNFDVAKPKKPVKVPHKAVAVAKPKVAAKTGPISSWLSKISASAQTPISERPLTAAEINEIRKMRKLMRTLIKEPEALKKPKFHAKQKAKDKHLVKFFAKLASKLEDPPKAQKSPSFKQRQGTSKPKRQEAPRQSRREERRPEPPRAPIRPLISLGSPQRQERRPDPPRAPKRPLLSLSQSPRQERRPEPPRAPIRPLISLGSPQRQERRPDPLKAPKRPLLSLGQSPRQERRPEPPRIPTPTQNRRSEPLKAPKREEPKRPEVAVPRKTPPKLAEAPKKPTAEAGDDYDPLSLAALQAALNKAVAKAGQAAPDPLLADLK